MANKYSDLKKKADALQKEKKNAAGEMLREAADKIFEKYSALMAFSWSQYTPYFNDGETCYFSVHCCEPGLLFKGEEDFLQAYEVDNDDYDKISEEVSELIGSIDQDDLKTLFGDHVKVVVHRKKKTEIKDYSSHD